MNRTPLLLAGALALSLASAADAKPKQHGAVAAQNGVGAQTGGEGSAAGGTGGSATAGDTAASTLGVGATTTGPDGTASALGTDGSAVAGEGGHVQNKSHVNQTGQGLMGHSKAQAMDHGTFSKSMTKTRVNDGSGVTGTTRTMSHVPGSKPVKSTSTVNSTIPQ